MCLVEARWTAIQQAGLASGGSVQRARRIERPIMSKTNSTDGSLPSLATSTERAHRRKRVSKPKTRTGCFTCKQGPRLCDREELSKANKDYRIRRVKCDEQRPECARCTKFGTNCDGYPSHQKGTPEVRNPPLKIRPWLGPKSRSLNPPSRAPPHQPRPSLIASNETEERYLQAFRKDVIPELSGIWDSSFWDSIVLTACHEPFIRDGVLAIAAINLSIKEDRRKLLTLGDGAGKSKASAKHYQFALERFGRAVRTMRSTLTNDEQHLRKALIGCLLVFCFEGFQGYPKQALVHVISGYHLLQSWMTKKSYPLVLPDSTPPASSLIEKELMDAFNRLHTNAVTVMGDSCSMETYALELASGETVLQQMPRQFANFREAHRYMIHIMKGVAVFVQVRMIY
jgi:Fungal Zn(2)-Cys(6) binuclear cluster domain